MYLGRRCTVCTASRPAAPASSLLAIAGLGTSSTARCGSRTLADCRSRKLPLPLTPVLIILSAKQVRYLGSAINYCNRLGPFQPPGRVATGSNGAALRSFGRDRCPVPRGRPAYLAGLHCHPTMTDTVFGAASAPPRAAPPPLLRPQSYSITLYTLAFYLWVTVLL